MGTAATLQPKVAVNNENTGESHQPLTHEVFAHHMKAMAVHYKTTNTGTGGATHLYHLPVPYFTPSITKDRSTSPQPPPARRKTPWITC